ncbi:hypothetical protein [Butyrivibrio fibrisolvens]|uniref:hypothetical protein n=1 Tax=Butyrivibrio fibrisolvens TaxID=831 RepID=UPI0003B53F70|nr:hypothetical protein [Butyrivibrio fibrisolvens]
MRISGSYNQTTVNNSVNTPSRKSTNVKEYSNYLMQKFGCLTPSKNAAVSVTGGLLRKAMSDEKTGEWLERELSKVPDYIEAAQKSSIAHGGTLKSVFIEFGEEYSTMTTIGVFGDEGSTDPELDKWLEKIKEKRMEQKEAEKRLEQKQKEQKMEGASFNMEFRGKDLEDMTKQFILKMSGTNSLLRSGAFDLRA